MVKQITIVSALLILLMCARPALAQTPPAPCDGSKTLAGLTFEPFAARAWYAPLIADPRGAQTQFYGYGQAKPFPYMAAKDHIRFWEINIGLELPLAAYEKGSQTGSLLDCRGWGFGAWLPTSFHMIANGGQDSIPILNQDYRVAGAVKLAKAVTPRDLISFKAQFGHESTHLGDEFVVLAIDRFGDDFLRVNVSYEYLEWGGNWDHFFGAERQHSLSLRGSVVQALTLGGAPGWYSPNTEDGRFIFPSAVNYEPAFGVEYLPQGSSGWRPFVSYEGRQRVVYDYFKTSADQREDTQFTSSLVVGWRSLKWGTRGMPDVIARAYYGVNPHGQFRSQANFWMFGFGLMYRLKV